MKKIFDEVFENLGLILLFINVILYSYSSFKKNKEKALVPFSIYLVLTFLVLSLSIVIIKYFNKTNNLFLSHFYFIFQFVFLSLFYKVHFTKTQKKWVNFLFGIVAVILAIQYYQDTSLFTKFNLLEILITSLPLVIYSITHLYNSLGKPGKYMYINSAILIYLSVSTLIFILGNVINSIDKSLANNVWFLNKVFYVGYLLLILFEWKMSLWKTKD
ncbi:hypothetical protein [Lacinutrix sp. 5H-3-7-4]|uniref:hypothetical protein n=1 Tax=Lacinutrix sp. (strain 5H-3-7-4) TaxID=983544 RepID=UPI00020A3A63|nr:hypothetical protein [Lacinutrix sp. 5H-3-7-4]AEH01118.1 hypothetical protein Lacal_1270 [Lacinutrix sp. 5H-3-7-4]